METLPIDTLNDRLAQPRDWQEKDLETTIAEYWLVDQTLHFIPRRRYRGERSWSWRMWSDGRPIMGRGDYILGKERRDF